MLDFQKAFIYLALSVSLAVGGFGAGWTAQKWRMGKATAEKENTALSAALEQVKLLQERVSHADTELQKAKRDIDKRAGDIRERVRWRVAACPSTHPADGGDARANQGGRAGEGGEDFGAIKSGIIALGADLDRCAAQLNSVLKSISD